MELDDLFDYEDEEKKPMDIKNLYLAVQEGDDFDGGEIISFDDLTNYVNDSDYHIYKLGSITEVKVRLEVSPLKVVVKKAKKRKYVKSGKYSKK